jgi:16S rRNA (adenine1518-N6/adenine1519-N6)-dimethyltransferase
MGAKLGQHFLTDPEALSGIVSAAGVSPGDAVLEIGPGKGALTRPLLDAGARVTAIELDDALAAALPGRAGPGAAKLTVVNEDFLRLDLATLGPGPWRVAGNLPYAVASPILQKLLLWNAWTTAALMFQKEVALRIAAPTGGADYGLLALSVRARADADIAFELPPGAFVPRPKVDSAVAVLRRLTEPRIAPADEPLFWRLAKTAFTQRRKMAAGVLSKALGRSREDVEAAFIAAGVGVYARPEEIPFEAWAALARSLRA